MEVTELRGALRAPDAPTAIPKVIHQMWYDKHDDDATAPPNRKELYASYTRTWVDNNPDFSLVLWTGRMVKELWKHPRLARWSDLFASRITRHIELCDISRIAVLLLHGGVYVDRDFRCFRSIRPALFLDDGWTPRVLGMVRDVDVNYVASTDGHLRKMFNGFLMSAPGHPFWSGFLDEIAHSYHPDQGVMLNTGPTRLAAYAERVGVSETRTPQYFLDKCVVLPMQGPQQRTRECSRDAARDAYCATYWAEGSGWNRPESHDGALYYGVRQGGGTSPPVRNAVAIGGALLLLVVVIGVAIAVVAGGSRNREPQ